MFELSSLKFNVNTEKLKEAIEMVDELGTSVNKLKTPLKGLETAATTAGDAVVKGAGAGTTALQKQTKQTDMMGHAVERFYKEKEKAAKADEIVQKRSQSILEKQVSVLSIMGDGWSKGQAGVLAAAQAAGIANNEFQKLKDTLASQRRLVGGDPFDKSASGLVGLKQGLGEAREGYRQLTVYEKEYARLKAEGNGVEMRLVALNRKETDSLYRDKQRMIEQYKMLKTAQFDSSDTAMIEKQKNAYKDLVSNVKNLENTYKEVATAKRPLDNIRTVDATKRRDQLNYIARGTSVQLGDIGVSLAGGQNPITVAIQQFDQLRSILGGVGNDTKAMQEVMQNAFTQIVQGFAYVATAMGQFVVGAVVNTSKALLTFASDITGTTYVLATLRKALVSLSGSEASGVVKTFDSIGKVIVGISATLVASLTVGLIGVALAYKEIIQTSQDLSVALAMSGGAIAINKDEALKMSAALASTSGTSMQVVGVITEIAKAGNLGKDSIAGITKASLDLQKYGGIAVKDTVALYAKLADDPVKGLTELALKTGDVSQATLDHIGKLVAQGDSVNAVTLAIEEMNRVNGLASQQMLADMSPLEVLWSEMKGQLTSLKEEFYAIAGSSELVNVFATAWRTVSVMVSEVWFVIKGVGKEIGGLAAQLGALASGDFKGASNIRGMMVEDAKAARTAQDALTKSIVEGTSSRSSAEKQYINVMQAGAIVRREMTEADKAQNIAGIKAGESLKKEAEKYNNVSNLDGAGREKAKQAAIDKVRKLTVESMKAHGADVVAIEKKLAETTANIEEQYKPKKEKSNSSGINDSIKAEQKTIEDARKGIQRSANMQMDALNSLHKRELVNDVDFFNQKFLIEKESIDNSIDLLKQEQSIASKKKNSLAEVQAFQGKIRDEQDKLKDKELERNYALLDLQDKLAKASIKASLTEITALQEKNKAQKLDNELIGLTIQETQALKAVRADSVIALQAEHVAYMEKYGLSESSATAYELEKQKLNALREARNLDTDAIARHTEAERKKLNETVNEGFRKDGLNLEDAQAELNFRESLIGTYGVQKEEAKQAYELEKQMLQVNRKQTEDLISVRKQYNALLTNNPEQNSKTLSDLAAVEAVINSNAEKQIQQIQKGAKIAQKELLDGKFDKVAEGLADALVTGMTKGAKAGRKKLRDLIVAELEKTITLSITANIKGLLGGGQGGGLLDSLFGKVTDSLFSKGADLLGGLFGSSGAAGAFGASSTFGVATGTIGTGGLSAAGGTGAAALAELSTGIAGLGTAATTTAAAAASGAVATGGLGASILGAIPGVGWLALGIGALIGIFGSGKDKIPTVLNDLALFNNSLIGLPFLELAIGSDEAAQGLRDVMYGLENSSPTMRKLAGETLSLSVELLRATGDIAGAANLARNIGTRGMSEKEIAVYDYNEKLRSQIEAARAGASAAQAAAQAEEQLAKTRWDLAGKLNILLGRTTQKEFDRATQLAGTTDAASLSMLNLIFQMEDLHLAVDAAYGVLERSVAAERKLGEVRLKAATDLQTLLKASKTANTVEVSRKAAQAQLSMFLAVAKASGFLPSAETLKPLLDSIGKPSEDLFSTFEDYQRDFLKTSRNIAEMSGLADKQVTMEQKTLDALDAQLANAKAQLDALKGVDNSVKDVSTAVNDFSAVMQALSAAQS
jgi:hypothetical protein